MYSDSLKTLKKVSTDQNHIKNLNDLTAGVSFDLNSNLNSVKK
jgi:hypothetical protein